MLGVVGRNVEEMDEEESDDERGRDRMEVERRCILALNIAEYRGHT